MIFFLLNVLMTLFKLFSNKNTVLANMTILSFTDAPCYVAENACIESWVQSSKSMCYHNNNCFSSINGVIAFLFTLHCTKPFIITLPLANYD